MWHNNKIMELWDTHVHLEEITNLNYAVSCAIGQNVTHWVLVATGPSSYQRQSQLLTRLSHYPLRYVRAIGLHPEYDYSRQDLMDTAHLVKHEPIAAIGEIGLPSYRILDREQFNRNWENVYIQLSWAASNNLAVIIHAVHKSAEPMLRILEEFPCLHRVVFHWLKAPADVVREIVNRGYYVGITPSLSTRHRDRELLSLVPEHAVVLETDSPWPHNGQQSSSPALIADLVKTLSRISPKPFDWHWQTTRNARRLFGIA